MSWWRRFCDHSCLPSRHHPNEESWKDSRLIKTMYKECFKLLNIQSIEDVPSGIKLSHGVASLIHYSLCTNPCSMWEFYVGLGTYPWACVKRKISYNPWKGWHQVVIVIKIAVCKFKWSITKRSSAWSLHPLWHQWTCEAVPKSGSPIVEYGGAII